MAESLNHTPESGEKIIRRRQHFLLEWNCSLDDLVEFFTAVRQIASRAKYCRGGIGEIYLSFTGAIDQSNLYGESLCDVETVEDLLHERRAKIQLVKKFSRQPQPEKRWRTSWVALEKITAKKPETGEKDQ